MNTANNASNALLLYLDSLLNEVDQSVYEGNDSVADRTGLQECAGEETHYSSSRSEILKLLYFNVACIPMALIHSAVSMILDVEREKLPSGSSKNGYMIRRLSHQGRDIHLLDARDIFLPTGHPAHKNIVNGDIAHILVFEKSGVGLICDQVVDAVGVERNQIEWRSQRTSRPWLVGMLKEYERVLLAETEIIHIFKQAIGLTI